MMHLSYTVLAAWTNAEIITLLDFSNTTFLKTGGSGESDKVN